VKSEKKASAFAGRGYQSGCICSEYSRFEVRPPESSRQNSTAPPEETLFLAEALSTAC
jgi:hypothetical protein